MAKEKKNVEHVENVLEEGIKTLTEKREQASFMGQIAKDAAEQVSISKAQIMQLKDYVYYHGRGWGADAMDKSDEKEKFPDRVSPVFRKMFDIIKNMYEGGMEHMLDDYLSAMHLRGIDITIKAGNAGFIRPSEEEKEIIDDAVKAMQKYQECICEKNDYMNDVLAPAADNQNVTPKSKFKKLVEFAWKKEDGKDIEDKIQDELFDNELYMRSLEDLQEPSHN